TPSSRTGSDHSRDASGDHAVPSRHRPGTPTATGRRPGSVLRWAVTISAVNAGSRRPIRRRYRTPTSSGRVEVSLAGGPRRSPRPPSPNGSVTEGEPVQVDEVCRLAAGERDVHGVDAGHAGDVRRYRLPDLPATGVRDAEAADRVATQRI